MNTTQPATLQPRLTANIDSRRPDFYHFLAKHRRAINWTAARLEAGDSISFGIGAKSLILGHRNLGNIHATEAGVGLRIRGRWYNFRDYGIRAFRQK